MKVSSEISSQAVFLRHYDMASMAAIKQAYPPPHDMDAAKGVNPDRKPTVDKDKATVVRCQEKPWADLERKEEEIALRRPGGGPQEGSRLVGTVMRNSWHPTAIQPLLAKPIMPDASKNRRMTLDN